MHEPISWQWLGLCSYEEALDRQEHVWRACRTTGVEVCLALEHPATITFGRRATAQDVRASEDELRRRGIACHATERGGRATYHAPGQLVLYPIVQVARRGLGVDRFVTLLEEVMLEIAGATGIAARRDARGRGVWTDHGKLGSVGIRVREGVSCHGLALNVSLDLSGFDLIAPCGMTDVRMTSLRAEGLPLEIADVLPAAERALRRQLGELGTDMDAEQALEVRP